MVSLCENNGIAKIYQKNSNNKHIKERNKKKKKTKQITHRNWERLDAHEPDRLLVYCCCDGGCCCENSKCPPEIQSDSNPIGPELAVEIRVHTSSSDKSPPGLL